MASRGGDESRDRIKAERRAERERAREERKAERERIKEERAAERERKYQAARENLVVALRSGCKRTDFYPDLSAALIKRMEEGDPSVGPIQKRRLIDRMEGGIGEGAYKAIAAAIGQSMRDRKSIANRVCGNYHYFRQDNPVSDPDGKLSEGRITIAPAPNGDIVFSHWPPLQENGTDPDRDSSPEHEGYAYFVDNKLFMLGWKAGMLRLGIAHCPNDKCTLMSGYVLSIRSGGGTERIFVAAAILVHEDQTQLLESFRSESGIKQFQVHHSSHRIIYDEG